MATPVLDEYRLQDEHMREVNYRIMTSEDIPAGMRLKELAGWNQTPEDWQRFLQANPSGCFVAESRGGVCGTAATIIYQNRLAWIGMVLVDPAWRGKGIGTRLLELAIEHLDARGIPDLKLDATPQGKPIYEKLGFATEYEIERWSLQRQAGSDLRNELSVRVNLSQVVELDRAVFGADRGELLGSVNQGTPELTITVESGDRIAAYAFGRRGSKADHLGPWVAESEFAARLILDEFLLRSRRETIFVDCVKANPFAENLLREHGFQFSRPLTRMVRGPNANPGRPKLLCAILGPEFG